MIDLEVTQTARHLRSWTISGPAGWLPCYMEQRTRYFSDGLTLQDQQRNNRLSFKPSTLSQYNPPYNLQTPPVGPTLLSMQLLELADRRREYKLKVAGSDIGIYRRLKVDRSLGHAGFWERNVQGYPSYINAVWALFPDSSDRQGEELEINATQRHYYDRYGQVSGGAIKQARLSIRRLPGGDEAQLMQRAAAAMFLFLKELEADAAEQGLVIYELTRNRLI